MQYRAKLKGQTSLIHHAGTGIDPEHPVNLEIAKLASKKASQRTVSEHRRIRDLEVIKSLWLDDNGKPHIPVSALRSAIEAAARKTKEGPAVREGLLVVESRFTWDNERYGDGTDLDTLASNVEFTTPVVVQRSRILRTRAKFEPPWSVDTTIEVDDDLVDEERLKGWLTVAGARIGIGDWRPQKSGVHGRFEVENLEAI